MGKLLKAAAKEEIADGTGKIVPLCDKLIALFNVKGEFFALDNTCPHRGASLAHGTLDRGKVVCPWHGWEFDLRTGNLAMSEGVAAYRVELKDKEIWVEVGGGEVED